MKKEKDDLVHKVSVLFEDNDCAVLFKPAGLMVHPAKSSQGDDRPAHLHDALRDGKNTEPTLCDFILKKWPEVKNVGEPLKLQSGEEIPRPGIVHRIDRETSGALLIAKNQEVFLHLKKQFQDREIRKTYNAYVYGLVKKEVGSINLPLGRSKGDFRQYAHPAKARGEMREALTYFTTLSAKKDFSYLELMPKTGRTHQIRAHLKAIQHPIVCDRIYAKSKPCALGFNRLALHARLLTFRDAKGEEIVVEAPFPEDFVEAKRLFEAL